jgi:hypothetical protein
MSETLTLLLLVVWVVSITVLITADRADKFLWLPVLLAVTGVFSSLLPLAISFNVAVAANGATLILFIVSLEVLNPRHRPVTARIRRRTRP